MSRSKIFTQYGYLPVSIRNKIKYLIYHHLYIPVEPSIIAQFERALEDNILNDEHFSRFSLQHSLKEINKRGWITEEPDTKLLKINPLFSFYLKQKNRQAPISGLQQAYLDFYSAFGNYITDVYLNSGKDGLRVEGIKIVFYEFFNIEYSIRIAINLQEDFLHLFNLLDVALELGEHHQERLYFAQKIKRHLNSIPRLNDEITLQKEELGSFIGDIYYRLGEIEKAVTHYEKALSFFKKENLSQNLGMVYNNLGNLYADQYNLNEAQMYYKEAINCFEAFSSEEKLMQPIEKSLLEAYLNLGYCFHQNRAYDFAEQQYEKALSLAQQIKDELSEGRLLQKIGLLAYRRKDYAQAVEKFTQASTIYERFNYTFGIGELNQDMGILLSEIGNEIRAQEAYKTALEIFIFLEIPQKQAELYNNIAFIEYHNLELAEAKEHYTKGLTIAQSLSMEGIEGRCLLGLGSVNLELENLGLAEKYFIQAKKLFERRQEKDCLGDAYLNLSTVALFKKEPLEAIALAKKAKTIYEKIQFNQEFTSALANIAMAYQQQNRFNQAITHFEEAGRICLEIAPLKACEYFQQAGLIAYEQKKWSIAESSYKKAVELALNLAEIEIAAWIYRSLGYISDGKDAYHQAKNYFLKAYDYFKKTEHNIALADVAQILGIYHTEINETEVAIRFFKETYFLYQEIGDKKGMEEVKDNRQMFYKTTGIWFEF